MEEINWLTDVGLPALVAAITTVIGFSAWLTKWVEGRIEHHYDQLLEAQRQNHARQMEVIQNLSSGLAKIDELILAPALVVRNRLRSVYRGEGEPGAVLEQVNAAADKLEGALETSRSALSIFDVLMQAHAIKNSVSGIRGDLREGFIQLERDDPELGKAVDELTQLITALQDGIQLWIPSPPEKADPTDKP